LNLVQRVLVGGCTNLLTCQMRHESLTSEKKSLSRENTRSAAAEKPNAEIAVVLKPIWTILISNLKYFDQIGFEAKPSLF